VALDSDGNVYAVGYFERTVDFDPGPDLHEVTALGERDIFILKLDSAANFIWVKTLSSSYNESADGVALDDQGNLHVVGSFQGTIDFDPGTGSYVMFPGEVDAFILKLDENGDFIWARQLGQWYDYDDLVYAEDVAIDGHGAVLTVGYFSGRADFDPGPDTFNLTSAGEFDAFVTKLSAAGEFVWTRQLGSAEGDRSFGVALDSRDNVHIAGYFDATADFDPGPDTLNMNPLGWEDGFLWKLDAAGDLVWARQVGGSGKDGCTGLALDGAGNVYISGFFESTVDFDPGPETLNLTSAGVYDGFVWKLNRAGDFILVRHLSGTSYVYPYTLALDGSASVHAVGFLDETADFDPGPGEVSLTSVGEYDVFVWKLGLCTISLEGNAPTSIHFSPAFPSLSYDVVWGYLSDLRSFGEFSATTCLGTFSSNPAEEFLPDPTAGDGLYYLARGLNYCTEQGYGDSTGLPDPRDDLDGASPCP
jgi:hypothetical protein